MTNNQGKVSIKGILIILFFFIVSISLIVGGIYLSVSTTPKKILEETINSFYNNINSYVSRDESLEFNENFTLNSKIKLNSKIDENTKEIKNKELIKNLSKLDTNILLSQDRDNQKLLLKLNSKKDNSNYINIKYLIKDSTGYYYNDKITNKYVNVGTNNYFENLGKEVSNKDNMEYLNSFIIKSIINNIDEKDLITTKETIEVNNKNINTNMISVELDNNSINNIYKKVIKDLKNDKKSNSIINNYYYDFNSYKPKNNTKFIGKKEKIIIRVHTKGITNKFVKLEIVKSNEKSENKINYEKINDKKSTLYIIEKDKLKYELDITKENEDKYNAKIINENGKDVGSIIISKTKKEKIIDLSMVEFDKRLDVDYVVKYKDVTNKSYNEIISLDIIYLENNKNILSMSFNVDNEIERESNIKEDTSESILEKSLTTEQNTKKTNYFKDLKRDLLGG